ALKKASPTRRRSSAWSSPPTTCAKARPPFSASARRNSADAESDVMRPAPDPTLPRPTATAIVDCAHLVALILDDELDAALEAGLMAFVDDPALAPAARGLILATQRRSEERRVGTKCRAE